MNAPREALSPNRVTRNAIPMAIARMASRNSSSLVRVDTAARARGTTRRVPSITTTMITADLASTSTTSHRLPPPWPSRGTTSTITTTAMSWKIRKATDTSPVGDPVLPLLDSSLSTTAVELRAIRHPV